MPVRLFTLDEANGLLRAVEPLLDRAHQTLASLRDVRDQLTDLRIIWGDKILQRHCPDHAEYEQHRTRFTNLERELAETSEQIAGLGCEVKDLEQGLIDFYAARGEEVVYLCWKRGEPRIQFWHSLTDGFTGRQAIETF